MDSTSRIEQALDQALATIATGAPASQVARSALRVATLRQGYMDEFWLRVELIGLAKDPHMGADSKHAPARLVALVGEEQAELQRLKALEGVLARRTTDRDGETVVHAHGLAELEAHLKYMQSIYDEPVPSGMTPLDTARAAQRLEDSKVKLGPALLQQAIILEQIRDATFRYLLGVERSVLEGQATPDAIAQGQQFVRDRLAALAPGALDALLSAEDRLIVDDPEALSHVSGSCRRAIKAMADVFYPPSEPVVDDRGISREMDDAHYRNRLIEYVRVRRGKSTLADLLSSNLEALGTRLKSLDDLASKGVHTALSLSEAESCLSWTYMLAADLLRIDEQVEANGE